MTKTEMVVAGADAARPCRAARVRRGGRGGRGALLALLLSTASAAMLLAPLVSPAWAQGVVAFNIPAGDLGGVLAQIGRVAGQTIALPAGLARGRRAGPVVGRMSVREAVDRALAGTGLVAAPGVQGSLTIRPGPSATGTATAAPGGDGALAAIDVADLAGGTGDAGFTAGNTVTSDRLNIPFKESTKTVVGVTSEVIKAQALTSVLDAARNASNVTINYGAAQGGGMPSYQIRGFDAQNVLVSGRVSPRGMNLPVQDVERVDVIKGPTTDLTGKSLEGGAINIIPKAPVSEPIREASVFLGSRFYRTLAFDFGGPVAGAENLTYRLNVSGNTANTAFGGDRAPHEGLVSPQVRWDNGLTTVTAGIRYFDQIAGQSPSTVGNPFLDMHPIRIPRERPVGTDSTGASFRVANPHIDVEHKFGVVDTPDFGSFDFTFRNRTGYAFNDYAYAGYIIAPSYKSPLVVSPVGNNSTSIERQVVTQSDLITVHTFANYKQTVRLGIDYTNDTYSSYGMTEYPNITFDPRNPIDTLRLPDRIGHAARKYIQTIHKSYDDLGLAFQDKIDLFDRLHIMGTVRQDFYNENTTTNNDGRIKYNKPEYSALTYTAGAVYDITPWVSAYGTVGTGFVPNRGVLADGSLPPAQNNNLSEYGLKFSLLDDRLRITALRFDNEYSSSLIYDPAARGNVLGPGNKSTGLELDVQGQVTENVSLIASFGRTQFTFTGAKPGDAYPGFAPYTGKLFAVYSFTDGPLKGLQIGGGGEGIASSYTSFGPKTDNYKLPGHVIFNAMMAYRYDNISLSLNVDNLLDKYYYMPTQAPQFIPLGEGRRIMMQARITF
ncbi:TonB-dependent receptor (plasmid) [Methylobacterium currus]|uniref:TonB-dependent siderophore receptor n=1 Tax=Methylobacterium currus TaxID=2051553 RepID=UPI001E5FB0B3|nr:TonB-dependent receptor [Methylobacterium currus]UHC19946.1 TonB-dependent receptor [Methylobacterium currus]